MEPRIYIDTSVIGGYFDEEFSLHTKHLFKRIENDDFVVYFSEVNETELVLAPDNVRSIPNLIPKNCYKFLDLDEESRSLAEKYISEKVLGKSSMNDAYHIALSSVNRFRLSCKLEL